MPRYRARVFAERDKMPPLGTNDGLYRRGTERQVSRTFMTRSGTTADLLWHAGMYCACLGKWLAVLHHGALGTRCLSATSGLSWLGAGTGVFGSRFAGNRRIARTVAPPGDRAHHRRLP